ncbi:hypothetical protein QBL02_02400 [Leucobacter sp. UT-8R-CII-1-4]|uniref:hypothetical protein n=1 Tax=Leucobacter sp. UT-8R-CII-1-4 TaxID=3040075 RepID=UPI0024A91E3A|nr:hypothetical protein [Leucobacter sp. UT-8R-CII-1-4]MDI6022394.1 hypothetical protein [Leucobacter sp. UT-8R-CII-1-4]
MGHSSMLSTRVFDRQVFQPRYRVYIFSGPASDTAAWELKETSVQDAIKTAENLAEWNDALWSLALIVEGAEPSQEWLHGMDYCQQPETAAQWSCRYEMQSKYLRARTAKGLPGVLPNGKRSIRMFPEWCVDFPLWDTTGEHYPYQAGELQLSAALESELSAWGREWGSYPIEQESRPDAWYVQGNVLYERLSEELRDVAEIIPQYDWRQ